MKSGVQPYLPPEHQQVQGLQQLSPRVQLWQGALAGPLMLWLGILAKQRIWPAQAIGRPATDTHWSH